MEVLSRIDVLNDAIQYYWGRPERRCMNEFGTSCQYKPSPTSEGCAVGRLLPLDIAESLDQGCAVNVDRVWKLLPDNVKSLGEYFLEELQLLHDGEHFALCNSEQIKSRMSEFVDENQIIFPN